MVGSSVLGSRFSVLLSEISGPLGSAEYMTVDEPELQGQRTRRIKREVLIGRKYFARHETGVTAMAHWIHVYNHVRHHSSIAMKTLLDYSKGHFAPHPQIYRESP